MRCTRWEHHSAVHNLTVWTAKGRITEWRGNKSRGSRLRSLYFPHVLHVLQQLSPMSPGAIAAVCPCHISQPNPAVSTSSTLESSEARGSEPQEKEYEGLLHTPVENCFFWFRFWFLLLCYGLGLFVVFLFIFSKQLLEIICSLMEIGFSKPSFISISKGQTVLAKAVATFTLDKKCLHLQDKNTTFFTLA